MKDIFVITTKQKQKEETTVKQENTQCSLTNSELSELSLDEIREKKIPQMPHTLRGSLEALIRDNDFLQPVFTKEFIDAYQHYRFERDVWPDEGRPTAYEFKTTYQC